MPSGAGKKITKSDSVTIEKMKRIIWLVTAFVLFLAACQPHAQTTTFILDGDQVHTLFSSSRLPSSLLDEAGISLGPNDRLSFNGVTVDPDETLPVGDVYTIQVRRAVTVSILQPNGETQTIQTSALNVGQALEEAGFSLYAADRLSPPVETPLAGNMEITYQPARDLSITVEGLSVKVRSAAETVGQALAEAGISLQGLDYSIPPDSGPLPEDGQIRVVRVEEVFALTQKILPFKTDFQPTADLELDQQAIIQVGEAGLSVSRVRVRYEDGVEISRQTEGETVIRPPKDEVVGYGTQIVIRTVQTPDGSIEYWRSLYVYATNYSPCNSMASRCYYYTASGKPVKKGVIGVKIPWYRVMRGQPVYVPDYGFATIEDNGVSFEDRYWIDLGWSEEEWALYGSSIYSYWTTVYFLTPVPSAILYILP